MKAIIQNIVDKLEKLVKNYKNLQLENSKLQKDNDAFKVRLQEKEEIYSSLFYINQGKDKTRYFICR